MKLPKIQFSIVTRAEFLLVIVPFLLLSAASFYIDPLERFDEFLHTNNEIFTVLISTTFAMLVLFVRRARALRREITRREESEELANRLARHDPLTGLPNRRLLSEDLENALLRVQAGAAECAVLLLDLDRFKPINDAHGHAVGDEVLVEIANRLTDAVGEKGTVARMGGDEFACIIPYEAGSDVPTRLARQITRSVNQPLLINGVKVEVGSTIGLARAPQDGITASELLHGADLAMYEGKRGGRGDYRFFHAEMDSQLRGRATLERDLRAAVSAGVIVPHFQPVIDLAEGKIIGFEALARWPHPVRGMVQPDTFIPIAEDLGIIDQITYTMLRASCIAARDWPPALWVSVNISPTQLKDPWLASRLLAILSETGVAPGRLIMEVTENAIIDDMISAQQVFGSLQNAGVRIALDDFGKGYSSLYHLRQLRFDHLKIDGSFVQSMDSIESVEIVTAVAGLGKSLGMAVTAEGVQTTAEARTLRGIGCEHAQGFLFGKPLSASETLALLRKGGVDLSIAA